VQYDQQWGLGAINAAAAYAPNVGKPALPTGASGAGIVVGVIDTGVQLNNPELTTPDAPANDISPLSTDVVTNPISGQPRDQPNGVNLHATWVSDVIAGEFTGFGTLGVAYQATILSVRADDFGSCGTNPTGSGCTFTDDNQAAAINYIIGLSPADRPRIVNISLGGQGALDSNFETALSNAVAANIVFTIAAGNDNGGSVEFPAAYAVDPRYAGSVLAVGSVSCSGPLTSSNCSNPANLSISSFSAVADTFSLNASGGFVVAPGDNITTDCDTTGNCFVVSGTSFSAPTAAGALALLLQAFPTLTGKQAIALLENTAYNKGVFSNANIYGFGLIDLAAAFQAQGTMSIPEANGATMTGAPMAGSMVSTALGDSVARTRALMTVGYDSYQRPFAVNMAAGFHVAPRHSLQAEVSVPENSAQVVLADSQARLSLTTDALPDDDVADLAQRGRDDLRMPADHRADVNLTADLGRLSFQAWTGQNGMPPAPGLGAGENAFAMLAQPDHAVRAGYGIGPSWTIAAEAGGGSAYSLYGFTDLAPSHYDLAEVRFNHGPLTATFSAGQLMEPEGPLGSFLPRGSSDALPAQTAFSTARLDWTAADWLVISAEAGVGRTRASGGFLDLSQPAVSSQWALSARTQCVAPAADCLRFDVRLGQPTRIEGGTFTAVLGQIPTSDSQIVQFTQRQFSASPSGREYDLSLGVARDFSHLGALELRALGVVDENNQRDIPPNLGLLASWRSRF
jgi:hypothetical protein